MGRQIAQFSLIVVLAAGMSSCSPERERQAGPPAGTTTLDVRALDADGDGKIRFRGRVVENVRGCEVDVACILRMEVDGLQTSVIYHAGEWPPCENAAAVRQGAKVGEGELIEVHAGIVDGDELTTCTSSEFYIRRISGTRAVGPTHRVVLIAGAKSHEPRVHEYIKTVRLLKAMLDNAENVSGIRTELHLDGWPEDAAALAGADVIMVVSDGQDGDLYSPVPFMASAERMRTMERLMDAGVGLITFHFSTFAPDSLGPRVLDWVGGYFDWQDEAGQREWYSAIRTLDTTVVVAAPHHPIARGLPASFRLEDEFYYNLRFRASDPRLTPILSVPALESNREHGGVVAWAVERADGGRGVGTSTGHFFRNWEDPNYRKLLLNAIVWAAGAEVPQGGVESRFLADTEVTRALYGATHKALILTGRNHPAHDWALTTPVLKSILEADGRVHADVSYDIEDLFHYDLTDYDFLLLNYANWEDPAGLSDAAKAGLVGYLSAGGGLLVVHFANGAFHHSLPGAGASDWPEYRKIVRRVWDHTGDSAHDAYGPFRVAVTDVRHEITAGIASFQTIDELYYNQKGDEPIEPLLTARSKDTGRDEPMAWAYSYGQGRVFQTVLGHDTTALGAPALRRLLLQAGIWAAGSRHP